MDGSLIICKYHWLGIMANPNIFISHHKLPSADGLSSSTYSFHPEPSTGVERRGREGVTGSLWNVNPIINFLSTFWFRYSLENTTDQPKGFIVLFFNFPVKVSKFDHYSFPLASDGFTNYLFIWAFPSFLKCKETGVMGQPYWLQCPYNAVFMSEWSSRLIYTPKGDLVPSSPTKKGSWR